METTNNQQQSQNYKGAIATESIKLSLIAREMATDANWLSEIETTSKAKEIKHLCDELLAKVYETQDELSKLL